MSKVKIKAILKNKETNTFIGYGIKNKNVITYNDCNIITKITMDKTITIERKEEYFLQIKLKKGINLEGKYITKYGNLKVETCAKEIKIDKNYLKVIYDLKINNEFTDTFTYILEYSIDS